MRVLSSLHYIETLDHPLARFYGLIKLTVKESRFKFIILPFRRSLARHLANTSELKIRPQRRASTAAVIGDSTNDLQKPELNDPLLIQTLISADMHVLLRRPQRDVSTLPHRGYSTPYVHIWIDCTVARAYSDCRKRRSRVELVAFFYGCLSKILLRSRSSRRAAD
jgi:hypothetical protein